MAGIVAYAYCDRTTLRRDGVHSRRNKRPISYQVTLSVKPDNKSARNQASTQARKRLRVSARATQKPPTA